jgi:hypothetical protein
VAWATILAIVTLIFVIAPLVAGGALNASMHVLERLLSQRANTLAAAHQRKANLHGYRKP